MGKSVVVVGFIFTLSFFALSLADSWPVTVNLKTGKTVILNQNFTWNFYVPPPPPVPPVVRKKVGFHNVNFGLTKEQFFRSYADKKTTMKESPEEGVNYFDDYFEGYPAALFFYFKQGVFAHGEVVFKFNKRASDDYYKEVFANLEALYTKRLGKPQTDTRLFKEWLVDGYMVRLVLTSQNKRLFLAMVLEDQQLIPKVVPVVPTPNAAPSPLVGPSKEIKPSKSMDIEQLQDLMETL